MRRIRRKRKQRTHPLSKCPSGMCKATAAALPPAKYNHIATSDERSTNSSKDIENFTQHWFTSNGHTLGVGVDAPTESYFPNMIEISTQATSNATRRNASESAMMSSTVSFDLSTAASIVTFTAQPMPFTATMKPTTKSTTLATTTTAAATTSTTPTTTQLPSLRRQSSIPTAPKLNNQNSLPSIKRKHSTRKRTRKRPFRSRKLAALPQSSSRYIKNKYNIDYDTNLEEKYEIIHKTE